MFHVDFGKSTHVPTKLFKLGKTDLPGRCHRAGARARAARVCVCACVCVCVCLFRGIIPLVVCSKLRVRRRKTLISVGILTPRPASHTSGDYPQGWWCLLLAQGIAGISVGGVGASCV